jgi:hypothetical protein
MSVLFRRYDALNQEAGHSCPVALSGYRRNTTRTVDGQVSILLCPSALISEATIRLRAPDL